MTITIDRLKKSVPLYVQIAEGLIAQIESGELVPGDRLPSERELSESLSVQRETVRQALSMMQDHGLVYRRHGSGTYISEPKIERDAGRLFPFTRAMQRKGYKTGTRVIQFEKSLCNPAAARELNLESSPFVYFIQRLRLVNEEPVVLENTFIPAEIFPEMDQFDLSARSLYEVMETEYGSQVAQARQSLESVAATEFEAGLLGLAKGAPLMLERRLTFDQLGRRVEFSKDLFRGDRFRFTTERTPAEK
jgi:GntR family transcriptional regulator